MITDTRTTAFDLVAAKLNNPAILDPQINAALDEAEMAIRIYTNRIRKELVTPPDVYAYESLPPEMTYIWANMSADLLATVVVDTGSGAPTVTPGAIAGSIKSIREGDVSVEFNDSGGAASVSTDPTARIGSLLYDYESQLKAFRRLGW